jgi:hypothetical protein
MIKKVMNDRMGSVIISVILGLGLAALFRRACSGGSCVVIKAPNREDLKKYVYKVDDDCFKYTPYVVACRDGNTVKP